MASARDMFEKSFGSEAAALPTSSGGAVLVGWAESPAGGGEPGWRFIIGRWDGGGCAARAWPTTQWRNSAPKVLRKQPVGHRRMVTHHPESGCVP